MSKTTKDIASAIKGASTEKTSGYDTTAVVKRIEGNTAWVHIPGGVDETPVKMTISASEGDTVQVRVSGGTAFLVGNATAPPTDDTTAVRATTVATNAWEHAESAQQAADSAWDEAGRAKAAADSAQASATEANTQATYATTYANNALTQLSTVESVVDTLNWITTHSTFVPTTDTSVQTGKLYYLPADNALTLTDGTTTLNGLTFVVSGGTVTVSGTATAYTSFTLGVPSVTAGDTIYLSGCSGGSSTTYGLRYYQGGGGVYCYDGTKKATAVNNASYYIVVSNGVTMNSVVFTPRVSTTDGGDYEFEIVQNPTGNPSTLGYYELDTTEAVRDYVKAHLALTDDGLYILNDSSAYKMLLANDGMYIQAPNGTTVNQATANGNTIRAEDGTTIAHLGYDYGAAQTAGSEALTPYYSLGTRLAVTDADAYSSSNTYKIGDICQYNNKLYVCMTDITVAEAWTSAHWTEAKIGNWSTAEGVKNVAMYLCHAEGTNNKIFGNNNHGEGVQNVITRNASAGAVGGSHVEGYKNIVDAGYAHAEGTENIVKKNAGHVEGRGCVVEAFGGHAQNEYTIVGSNYQTAIGKYNIKDSSNVYALIIGNGSSSARSNALTVDWDGNLTLKGHSSSVGTVKTAYLTSAKSVATGTDTNLCSVSLEAGTWVITAGVRFPANASGHRRMNIATTSASNAADVQLPAVSGASTQLNYTLVVTPTATTTYYLNCYHNAGTTLSLIAGGGENGINFIRAVRIV